MNRHHRPAHNEPLAHCERPSTNSESPFVCHAESRHTSHAPRDYAATQAGYPSFRLATRPGLGATELPAVQGDWPGDVPANQTTNLPRCAIMWSLQARAVAQQGLDRKLEPWWLSIHESRYQVPPSDHWSSARRPKRLSKAEPATADLVRWKVQPSFCATSKRITFPSPGIPCL